MNKKLEEKILKKLEEVLDPEISISIVDLGLIYSIEEKKKGEIQIKMTLTTIGCPLFNIIEDEVKRKVLEIEGVKKVEVELTFDPPWSPERMSEKAKAKLGFI